MEAKCSAVGECSLPLQCWERGCDSEAERGSAAPPETAASPAPWSQEHVSEHTGEPLVLVKAECDAEDLVPQKWHARLASLPDHTEIDITQNCDSVMKTEVEVDETAIKQELDVGPTVLQPQGARRARLDADKCPEPGGAAPTLPPTIYPQTAPNTKVEGNHYEDVSGVQSDSSSMLYVGETDYVVQECHRCGRRVGPQSKCYCVTDVSKAKTYTHTAGNQYNSEHRPYFYTNRSYFMSHIQTGMDQTMSDYEQHEHSGSRLDNLEKDVACRRDGQGYKYSVCSLGNLKEYGPTHTNEKPYKCERCEYSTTHMSDLKIHIRIHTGEKPYECEHCDYRASRLYYLKSHIRTHTGEKPYKCEHCEYSTSHLGSLKNHIRTHTGEKPFKCEQCEYSASQLNSLKSHIRTHTGEKPYKCEQCEYSASQLQYLKKHMLTHTGKKPYKCELCEYSASQSNTLKKHIRTHTGEKPFKCEQCGYSAAQLYNLKKHIRTHTHEKLYKCEQCEYSASQLSNLKNHLRTHTREKPYRQVYSASQLQQLKIHIRNHTGQKPSECEQCKNSAS